MAIETRIDEKNFTSLFEACFASQGPFNISKWAKEDHSELIVMKCHMTECGQVEIWEVSCRFCASEWETKTSKHKGKFCGYFSDDNVRITGFRTVNAIISIYVTNHLS